MNTFLKELKVDKVVNYYEHLKLYTDDPDVEYFMTHETLTDMLLTDKSFQVVQKRKRTWIETIEN